MNQIRALQQIRDLGAPTFETRDIAALLRVTPANASVILGRLAARGFVERITRGRWSLGAGESNMVEQLAAPLPAYISLQSALFRRGVIEQVPQILYVVTLGRTRRFKTPAGGISFHRVPVALFGGYETGADGAKLATAEKALFDLMYLGPTRSRLFGRLPEFELPKGFKWSEVSRWVEKIAGASRRSYVERRLRELKGK